MLSGDFSRLAAIVTDIRRLGALKQSSLAKNLAAELLTQAQLGFRDSVAPEGTPWAPLKIRRGKPLLDSGAHLMGSLHIVAASSDRIQIAVGFAFAAVHQLGKTIRAKPGKSLRIPVGGVANRGRGKGATAIYARQVVIPARPMLPTSNLPDRWATPLREAAEDTLRALLGSLRSAAE